ncbi:MAG: hypothetical protein SGJ19_25740 [Planctomycetia bacterium]|nr:hypothetical protein [Planctomycetia bacterium]
MRSLSQIPLLAILLVSLAGSVLRADIVVIANRAAKPVRFTVAAQGGKPHELRLAPLDLVPVRIDGPLIVNYPPGDKGQQYEILPNSAYFFADTPDNKKVELHEIGLRRRPAELADSKVADKPAQPVVLTVKILVDDDQPLHREIWEKDLRQRIADCSKILEQHCFARLEVVAVETWDTNDAVNDFDLALNEFEAKVDPAPARIAIGFTSQFQPVQGRTNLGGVRGPFCRHALLREWNKRVAPAERLELLVHELGHFFGAAHSPENTTVMRPILADKQANSVKFQIAFDPLNTLAMNLITSEMGRHEVRSLRQLDLRTRQLLAAVYWEIDKALPKDDAASRLLAMVGPVTEEPKPTPPPYVPAARRVLASITKYAERNAQLPEAATDGAQRLVGDELADAYYRQAAAAAVKLSPANAAKGCLIGLAVALDRSEQVRGNPLAAAALSSIETADERRHRLEVIGNPTLHGREDLLLHFTISAGLSMALSPKLAESAGVLKELKDAQGGSGFSFADLSADLAGVEFARKLAADPKLLGEFAKTLKLADYAPASDGLPEGLDTSRFVTEFGSPADARYQAVKSDILGRIKALPGHVTPAPKAE